MTLKNADKLSLSPSTFTNHVILLRHVYACANNLTGENAETSFDYNDLIDYIDSGEIFVSPAYIEKKIYIYK